MGPAVSVIIVSYNRADDLRLAIEAVIATGYAPLEILVVDNASSDDAAAVAESFAHVRVIRSSTNVGFAEGCNIGLRAATGEYIALVNNDAVIAPDWIHTLVTFLEAHPKAAAAGGKVFDWNDHNPLGCRDNAYYAYPVVSPHTGKVHVPRVASDQVTEVTALSGAAVMIRRAVIDAILETGAAFLEPLYFTYYEETDFFARALRLGHRLYYTSEPVAWHRVRASGNRYHYDFHMERNRLLFAYRNFSNTDLALTIASIVPRALETLAEDVARRTLGSRLKTLSKSAGPDRVRARVDAWRWWLKHRALLNEHRAAVAHVGMPYAQAVAEARARALNA